MSMYLLEPGEQIPVNEELIYKNPKKKQKNDKIEDGENGFPYSKELIMCMVIIVGLYFLVDNATKHLATIKLRGSDSAQSRFDEKVLENLDLEIKLNSEGDIDLDVEFVELMQSDIDAIRNQLKKIRCVLSHVKIVGPITRQKLSTITEKVEEIMSKGEIIENKIKKALEFYDADKLFLYDYAAEYAGGEVVSIGRSTIPYATHKVEKLFGMFAIPDYSSPKQIISQNCLPGNCFCFYGNHGSVVIKLSKTINIKSFAIEQSLLDPNMQSAPKNFRVYGFLDENGKNKDVLGEFTYDISKKQAIQKFDSKGYLFGLGHPYEFVELEILNNYDNPLYTCVYRFRVHAK